MFLLILLFTYGLLLEKEELGFEDNALLISVLPKSLHAEEQYKLTWKVS